MRRALAYGFVVAVWMAAAARGQGLAGERFGRDWEFGGVRLYGVSVFLGYSTSAYPSAGPLQAGALNANSLGGDTNYGVSATAGWQYHRGRTNVSAMYSGTYQGLVQYSDANGFNQTLSLSLSRKLSPRWTLTLSGNGQDMTSAQFMFQPNSLTILGQLPASFDDLAALFAAGQISSSQLASILTSMPVQLSPARSLLLGDRVLSYTVQTGLVFNYSPRISFHVSGFSASGQHRSQSSSSVSLPNYALPRSYGGNAGLGISYSMSPRTRLGFNLDENVQSTRFQRSVGTTATASVGRRMGMRWFLRMYGGGSVNQVLEQSSNTPRTRQLVGGGSLGFSMRSSSLLASYDRTSIDAFGLALGTTTSAMGSWQWRPRNGRWGPYTSFSQQQVRNTGFLSISGWQATGGINLHAANHTEVSMQYVYVSSRGRYQGRLNEFSTQGVRLAVSWTPEQPQH